MLSRSLWRQCYGESLGRHPEGNFQQLFPRFRKAWYMVTWMVIMIYMNIEFQYKDCLGRDKTVTIPPYLSLWKFQCDKTAFPYITLHWRHNDHGGVSNHQPYGCLLNRLFRRRSKKTSKLRVTGHCAGNSPGPVNSLHKGPVTRKMVPFDDVIMKVSHRRRFACIITKRHAADIGHMVP